MTGKREQTRERILTVVRGQPGLTSREIADRTGTKVAAARDHLKELCEDGFVDERTDWSVPTPRGDGIAKWYALDPPIGRADPTDLVLCDTCAVRDFHSTFRYSRARTEQAMERMDEIGEAWVDREDPGVCDSCGGPLFTP